MTDAKYPALLDADRAIVLLREVVAEFGKNHVYTKRDGSEVCAYVHGDADELVPGCIVAQVLHRHGVPMNVLSQYEGLGAVQLGDSNHLVRRGVQPLLTEAAGIVLSRAQWAQDSLMTWGTALREAEKTYAYNNTYAKRVAA